MSNKGVLQKEISHSLSRRLGLTLTVGLVAGLLLSLGLILLFAKIVEDVVGGESHRFDETGLLLIYANSPTWLDEPMRIITTLGYYWVVLPLLAILAYAFYRLGRKVSAALLVISTVGGLVLTTTLKTVFQRSRPELFDSGYTASFYSFPSVHATSPSASTVPWPCSWRGVSRGSGAGR